MQTFVRNMVGVLCFGAVSLGGTMMAPALLAALAGFAAVPNVALAAAPQHHDQVPGFYRLKVGDLEVTALYDGTGVFDPHWLNGTKATMDSVARPLQKAR